MSTVELSESLCPGLCGSGSQQVPLRASAVGQFLWREHTTR